ncbi:MAG: SDR family NAD(P)-dependent oxidoreductase [Planctomycetota bacterium]
MKLLTRTAIVTGAGRGIGRACAVELAKAGASVVVNDRHGSQDLQETAAMIAALGQRCLPVEANIFERPGCEQLCEAAAREFGRIDVLISNPAFSHRCSFLEYSPDMFERTIQGTLTSGFHMSQIVARHMVAQRRKSQSSEGCIIFISSVQAEMPIANCVAYNAAKAGLNHMMSSIAVELAEHRIRVNAIEPGWIDTPAEHVAFTDDVLAAEGRKLPWGRLGLSEDIGRAAVFLASDDAEYITGTVLPVDGAFRFKDCRATQSAPVTGRSVSTS